MNMSDVTEVNQFKIEIEYTFVNDPIDNIISTSDTVVQSCIKSLTNESK